MPKKILITAALPYANGPIHFGHLAGAYLPADCYTRFQKLLGNEAIYICGSDEYGVAISMSAELAGRTPKEHVDINHEINKKLFSSMLVNFDHYSRTTWERHGETVIEFFNDLMKNGYIEAREIEQLYSEEKCRFFADRYVVGSCPKCGFENARGDECTRCGASYEAEELKNPRTKIGNLPLILKKTKHWYIRLDLFKEKLMKWLDTRDWKPNVVNFVKSYVQELKPRAITRDMSWGIPVPLAEAKGKVFYVWFDAPIGYISATKEWALLQGKPERWKDFWLNPDVELVQFIGKDNIPFHAIIFPAMIMGQNTPYRLVDELPANEFYNLAGRQFSKSEGWYVDLAEAVSRYSPDQLRYAIVSNAPETQDSEFTWKDFQSRCNGDLAGKFGNLAFRTLVFLQNKCGGKIPPAKELQKEDEEFLSSCRVLAEAAKEAYSQFRLRKACQIIMELAQKGNVYFDFKKPWAEAKRPEGQTSMQTTLSLCLECLKVLSIISSPVLPQASQKLARQLGFHDSFFSLPWDERIRFPLEVGKVLEKPETLFRKIEDSEIAEEEARLQTLKK